MPVNDAEGDEVGSADSDPPGVDDAAGLVVVVVLLGAVLVFVNEPDATVVVVLPPVAPVVVVVELALGWLFLVLPDFGCVSVVVLVADGVDEPHAAAIRPPARTTTPIANLRPTRRRPWISVEWGEFVVCKVFVPHSSCSWHRKRGEIPTCATDAAVSVPRPEPGRRE
jgi:hypothetical protein